MIYWHETHEIVGGKTADFQQAVREQWQPLVERDDCARLLWFWDHGHGTGPSYQAISLSAVPNWSAWGRLIRRLTEDDDGRAWFRDVAPLRRRVTGKLLLPVDWSPLREVDAKSPIPSAASQDVSVYLHDTGWPFPGRLEDYIAALGGIFFPQTRHSQMISVAGCWRTCPGTGMGDEVLLLQKILNWDAFGTLLSRGESTQQRGGWMDEGLKYRDRWESKLLRTVSWSPRQ